MKARRALTAAALTTGLVLTVAGCGGDENGGGKKASTESTSSSKGRSDEQENPEKPAGEQVLDEVTGDEGITLTVNSAVRDQGGFLTVRGKVTNGGPGRWIANSWRGEEQELQRNAASMAGATLVDKSGKKRYLILRDTEGRCLCTTFTSFKPGEEKTWYAQFPAPPEDSTKVTFQIADMPPADIKISEGE